MKEKTALYKPILIIQSAAGFLLVLLALLDGLGTFFMALVIWLLSQGIVIIRLRLAEKEIDKYLNEMGEAISKAQSKAMTEFPFPVMVVKSNGEITWHNYACKESILQNKDAYGKLIEEIIPDVKIPDQCPYEGVNVTVNKHMYTMYSVCESEERESMRVIYFIDDHNLKYFAGEYHQTRPVLMLLMIDNYEELFQGLKENERGRIISQVENVIERFIEENGGLVRKLERERYLAIVEERRMKDIVAGRFAILDEVRTIDTGDKIPPTMSIGVGRDTKSYHEGETAARQALDMALGRGGDQAAVKTKTGYEFYGGVSKGIEKRSKVRSRVVAAALSELIAGSSNVIVMGHRFGDLDSLGASVGMCKAASLMGKPAYIALEKEHSVALPLVQHLFDNGYHNNIITPQQAMHIMDKTTLLIIVDTHIVNIVESRQLYEACKNVVVIDHHRKMVGHIDNAVIFYHEPFASSTAEMVAELTQYLGDGRNLGVVEAEALLAGIMLDTKNFTIRTGVRTFEAAAYLRRMGADTIRVRKLFSSSMNNYQQKARLVSSAEVYMNCAITTSDSKNEDMMVISAQAADELLTISGVDASFVIYEIENGLSVSARSMGAVNVQLIMEELGGGGHHTMAGAQIYDKSIDDVRQMLLEAIEKHLSTIEKTT